ncbi:unnamed protein product [Bemisia tabaci]|uniref:alpha-glucosidase n=1 Tax=Bemisia tabaci TaxID=7038 RepID=A0A9P0A3R3_BEMTA|nr:unnamed protein product [Bemisia tabaci]
MVLRLGIVFCIAAMTASCDAHNIAEGLDWWQSTFIYQIYPRSFKDSNGDGIGDLNGILEKLDYIKAIGVDTMWIQPFYKSPMVDTGYDVSDYISVDPSYGSMEDFKRLLKATKEKGMKLIVDFVPNHSSDQHEWFKLSEQRIEPYTDFYVWHDGRKVNDSYSMAPNNWIDVVHGSSAWTWSEKRRQYYYHQFVRQQPDLNLRNPRVVKELENVLKFWLDLGVDGFRVDAARHLYEATHLKDEKLVRSGPYNWIEHEYTHELPENYELFQSWRTLLDEYSRKDGRTRILCTEDYDTPENLKRHLGNATKPGAHIPFYFYLTNANLEQRMNSTLLNNLVLSMKNNFPQNSFNWVLDNHDRVRVTSRFFPESGDSWLMLVLLLPGAVSIYYGTEIGMENSKMGRDQHPLDGHGQINFNDDSRTPMQWDDTENAGFTSGRDTWLPVHPNYWLKNVRTQEQDPKSHLNIFKRLVALRKSPVITHGDFETYAPKTWVYMITRSFESQIIVVLMNIGSSVEHVCPKETISTLPDKMFVYTGSVNSGFNIGDEVIISKSDNTRCVTMRPQSGLVLSTSVAQ